MTRTRKICMAAFAALCAVTLGLALSACGGKDTEPTYGYGEEGSYYYTASDGSEYLLTLQKGTAMQSYDGGGSAAEYFYDAEDNLLIFAEDGEETATGTFTEGNLNVTYNGRNYLFLSYEYYTVVFTDGGVMITTQSVLNGKAAQDPGEATKDGYVFLGWYTDALFTERYGFNTSVTSDTTVYARFMEITSEKEYTVTFDYIGETVETINGVIYNLPTPEKSGYTFLGWWVSATNNADELTYKYDGETLYEDTTLFAFWAEGTSYMGASVYDDGLTWENYNASVTEIVLRDETGAEIDRLQVQSTDGAYAYDFASLPAGRYTLVIHGGGVDETLTYVSHGLYRVSGFTVVSGSVLVYDEVPWAEGYCISVECGSYGHDHGYVDIGTSLYYDFSGCDMPAEGITFTVYAYAEGYYYSVSSYNYFLGLERAEVTVEGSLISWDTVPYAMGYEVYIDGTLVATTFETSFSLAEYGTGIYEIAVRPVTTGYYSEKSEIVTFTKTTLASPEITGIEDYTVTWTPVEGAAGYTVSINGTETTIGGGDMTSLILSGDNYTEGLDSYEISVKALAPDSANDSPYGESVTVTGTSVGSAVSYNNGTVTWQYSLSASEYRITVNDGDETVVFGRNSSPVTLTRSGNNEINIYFVDADDNIYGMASITVYAYAIVFDARGGTAYMGGEPVDTIYVVKGDTVTLPDAEYGAYTADFVGWYTLPDVTNDPDATEYQGDGVLFEDGTVFTGNATIVLYACWLNPRFRVMLDAGDGILTDADGNRIYETEISLNGRNYTIAVPDISDKAYVFYGWYSGENGTGTRYTDELGNAYAPFDDMNVTTLYAYWIQVLSFSVTTYNGHDFASVAKGADINLVSSVTVPETYTIDGTELTVGVMTGGAFQNCSSLEILNIPDTMQFMDISGNGYSVGVFQGTALTDVNVYVTGEPSTTKEVAFYSDDGVLFWINDITGKVEPRYYPYGRTDDTYVMPSYVSNENEYELQGLTEVPVVREVTSVPDSLFRDRLELVSVTIPETVTETGTYLFYGCTNLRQVIFEAEIGKIEDYTFYDCISLVDVETSDTVREIGVNAFHGCVSIVVFDMPNTVETIGGYAFSGCSGLLNAYLSSNLESIGDYCFSECTALRAVDIPFSVTEIGSHAFYRCSSMTQVIMQDTLTSLGTYAFAECTSLVSLTISAGLETISDYTFYGCSSITALKIPEGVVTINQYAFAYLTSMTELSLPDSLVIINASVFLGCSSLMTVVIPENVQSIGNFAFQNCYKLMEVYNLSPYLNVVAGQNNNGYVAYYAKNVYTSLSDQSRMSSVDGLVFVYDDKGSYYLAGYDGTATDLVLPTYVDGHAYEINQYAFYGVDYVTSVYVPDTVTAIGQYAFYGCTDLERINIPEGITAIPDYCFYGCTSLINIVLPDSVTSVGTYAFRGCKSLVRVTLGAGLQSIGNYAFYECIKLVEVCNRSGLSLTMGNSGQGYVAYYAKNICSSDDDTHMIYTDGNLAVYDAAGTYYYVAYLGDVANLVLPDQIGGHAYEIMEHAFDGNKKVESVVISDGVTKIGDYAFNECINLASIDLSGKYLAYIGMYAFYGCSSLSTLTLPGSMVEIFEYAFAGCDGLETVIFEDGVEAIGAYAFADCVSLRQAVLPDTLTYLGDYCFSGCSKLSSLNMPRSLQYIGDYVFYEDTSLKQVELSVEAYHIGQYAFFGCSEIVSVTLSGEFIEIGQYAFSESGVKDLTMNYQDLTIDSYAFYRCSGLETLTIDASGTFELGSQVFRYDTALRCAHLDGLTSMEGYNLRDCTNLEYLELGGPMETMGTYNVADCTSLRSVWILPDTTYLATYTFSGCDALTTVRISGLQSADTYAFNRLYALVDLTIDEGVEYLGQYMFANCTALKEVTIPSTIKSTGNGPFYECTALEKVTFAEGATYIGSSMFSYCSSLKEVYFPASMETVESSAFNHCDALEELHVADLGAYAETIAYSSYSSSPLYNGADLYVGDELVTDIDIPEGTESINKYAFDGYENATSITIPSTLTSMATYAFRNCYNVKDIYFNATNMENMSSSNYVFYNVGMDVDGVTVHVSANVTRIPGYLFNSYSSASYAPNIVSVLFDEGSVCEEIGQYAFRYVSAMTEFDIPSAVTEIGNYAFANCTGLKDIVFPAALETVGQYAFSGCSALETITLLGNSLSSVGSYAFQNCNALSAVYTTDLSAWLGINFSSYNANPMYYGAELYVNGELVEDFEDLVVPAGTKRIGSYMFYQSSALKSITLPSSVTEIGSYAFYQCTGLTEITIPENLTEIGTYAFSGCSNLETVTFLCTGLDSVGNYAFQNCSALDAVYIADLGGYASANFGNQTASPLNFTSNLLCLDGTAVTDLIFPEGTTKIGSYAFYGFTNATVITIPSTVTAIGNYAFRECTNVTVINYNATACDDVSSGSNYAFYNVGKNGDGITLYIGANVQRIPGSLFYSSSASYTANIVKVVFEEGAVLEEIGQYAFRYVSTITEIDLPSTVTTIGQYAFANCTGLTGISLPEGLVSLGNYAFYNDTALMSVTFLCTSPVTIGNYAFSGCSKLGAVYVSDLDAWLSTEFGNATATPLNVGADLYVGGELLTDLVIPDGTTRVGAYAFYGCSSITGITIPSSVTSIGNYAFYNCYYVTTVNFNATAMENIVDQSNYIFYNVGKNGDGITVYVGANVTRIPAYLFTPTSSASYAPNIVTVIFEEGSVCEEIANFSFRYLSNLTSINIPDSVKSIGQTSFYNDTGLKSLMLPANLEYIGPYAFQGCTGFTTIVIPDSVTEMGNYAFYQCTGLTEVHLGAGLVTLGDRAFYGCTGLTTIILPAGLETVGTYAFSGCSSLTTVTFLCTNLDSVGNYAFQSCSKLSAIYIADLGAWAQTDFGGYYGNPLYYTQNMYYLDGTPVTDLAIPEGVTKIGTYAFYGFENATAITIPTTVTSIGNYAFYGCYSVTSIVFNAVACDDISSSSNYVFYYTGKDTDGITVTIGAAVTYIPAYLFSPTSSASYAPNIVAINFADGSVCETIGDYAFRYITNITSIELPASLKTLGGNAFYGDTGLKSVTLYDGLEYIGNYAFYNCSNLSSIYLPSTLTYLGTYAFYGCSSLTSVVIPDGITEIQIYAFYNCSSLVWVIIGDGTESIGDRAFYGCSSMEWIVVGSGVESIGASTFYNCSKLSAVYYAGDYAGWQTLSGNIGSSNSPFTAAAMYYYSATQPTTTGGNWWYWDEDGEPAVWKL